MTSRLLWLLCDVFVSDELLSLPDELSDSVELSDELVSEDSEYCEPEEGDEESSPDDSLDVPDEEPPWLLDPALELEVPEVVTEVVVVDDMSPLVSGSAKTDTVKTVKIRIIKINIAVPFSV